MDSRNDEVRDLVQKLNDHGVDASFMVAAVEKEEPNDGSFAGSARRTGPMRPSGEWPRPQGLVLQLRGLRRGERAPAPSWTSVRGRRQGHHQVQRLPVQAAAGTEEEESSVARPTTSGVALGPPIRRPRPVRSGPAAAPSTRQCRGPGAGCSATGFDPTQTIASLHYLPTASGRSTPTTPMPRTGRTPRATRSCSRSKSTAPGQGSPAAPDGGAGDDGADAGGAADAAERRLSCRCGRRRLAQPPASCRGGSAGEEPASPTTTSSEPRRPISGPDLPRRGWCSARRAAPGPRAHAADPGRSGSRGQRPMQAAAMTAPRGFRE